MFMYLLLSGIRVTPIMFLLLTVNQASRAWNVKAQKGQRRRRSKEDRCQLSRIYSQLRIQLVTLKPPQWASAMRLVHLSFSAIDNYHAMARKGSCTALRTHTNGLRNCQRSVNVVHVGVN